MVIAKKRQAGRLPPKSCTDKTLIERRLPDHALVIDGEIETILGQGSVADTYLGRR